MLANRCANSAAVVCRNGSSSWRQSVGQTGLAAGDRIPTGTREQQRAWQSLLDRREAVFVSIHHAKPLGAMSATHKRLTKDWLTDFTRKGDHHEFLV